jgi:UrcA family protein
MLRSGLFTPLGRSEDTNQQKEDSMNPAFHVALTGGILLCMSGAVFAQDAQPSEEVTVLAPYVVEKKVMKTSPGSIHSPVLAISTERHVSYSDLDLSKPEDAAKLESRIIDAAKEACAALDKQYPVQVYVPVGRGNCVKDATREALSTARVIIAASHG